MAKTDRRREERLNLDGFGVWLKHEGGATVCDVVDISRLGVGLQLPQDSSVDQLPPLNPETIIPAILTFENERISLSLKVLRINGDQLGCSFQFADGAVQRKVFSLLSPRFVAASLSEISPSALAADVRSAHFGLDFSIVAKKEGRRYVICTLGAECDFHDGFVEVKNRSAFSNDFDVRPLHAPLGNEASVRARSREILEWVKGVLSAWPECPEELLGVVCSAEFMSGRDHG